MLCFCEKKITLDEGGIMFNSDDNQSAAQAAKPIDFSLGACGGDFPKNWKRKGKEAKE